MRKSAKLKASRQREKQRNLQHSLDEQLDANAVRLKTMTAGFTLANVKIKKTNAQLLHEFRNPKILRRVEAVIAPSMPDPKADLKKLQDHLRYNSEMLVREKAAQAIIREKKKLAMPLYNKGGLQMPTSADLEAFRNGELRRRS